MNKKIFSIFLIFSLVICIFQIAFTESNLPNIKIIATGGTIAGTASSSTQTTTYTSAVLPVEKLIDAVPEIKEIANVSGEQICQIDSSNMSVEIWLKLGGFINELLLSDEVDGVVITHGTDTMEETAYFLNLVVKSDKPVVLTGSMRPATALSADGPINLYNAVALAGSEKAKGKGVLVALNDVINGARDVTKTNTSSVDTFKSPDFGYSGYIQDGEPYFYRLVTRKHTTMTDFDITGLKTLPEVVILYGYGGDSPLLVNFLIEEGVKGIVYAGPGNGNISTEVKEALVEAQKKGIVIVRSARVGSGIVARNGDVDDDKLNFVAADTLNPQKARILLMLALTKTSDPLKIQEMFWEY